MNNPRMAGFLDKLLGRKKAAPAPPPPPQPDPRDEEPIVCYDAYGREMHFTRAVWRTQVLPEQLAKSWNDYDALAGNVILALGDGFAREVLEAAQHLHELDPDRERGASLRTMALLESGNAGEAERVVTKAIRELPRSAMLRSDLALVRSRRGDDAQARRLAWEALELDPNLHNALSLFVSTSDDKTAAARRVSELPRSWRAALWVAVDHLNAGELASAIAIYERLLTDFPDEPELLVNISGDLGRHGHFAEAVRLVLPRYDPRAGELTAGFNLLQILLELHDRKRGEELLHLMQLAAIPPERERLLWYSARFAELDVEIPLPVPVTELTFEMLHFEHPIWTYGPGDLSWLFPKEAPDAPRIAILTFSEVRPPDELLRAGEAIRGREDELGRLTRALPLHLADALRFRTAARASVYMPVAGDGGMVVMGSPAAYESVETMTGDEPHVITGAIDVTGDAAELRVELWERGTNKPIAQFDERGPVDALPLMYARTERELLRFLHETNIAAPREADPRFLIADEHLRHYFTTIGQVYALTVARARGGDGLFGERNIHRWVLNAALEVPESSLLKIAMVSALANSRRRGSKVYLEIEDETLSLFESVAPDDPAYLVTPALFRLFELDRQFNKRRNELLAGASEEYVKWLADLETLFG